MVARTVGPFRSNRSAKHCAEDSKDVTHLVPAVPLGLLPLVRQLARERHLVARALLHPLVHRLLNPLEFFLQRFIACEFLSWEPLRNRTDVQNSWSCVEKILRSFSLFWCVGWMISQKQCFSWMSRIPVCVRIHLIEGLNLLAANNSSNFYLSSVLFRQGNSAARL